MLYVGWKQDKWRRENNLSKGRMLKMASVKFPEEDTKVPSGIYLKIY